MHPYSHPLHTLLSLPLTPPGWWPSTCSWSMSSRPPPWAKASARECFLFPPPPSANTHTCPPPPPPSTHALHQDGATCGSAAGLSGARCSWLARACHQAPLGAALLAASMLCSGHLICHQTRVCVLFACRTLPVPLPFVASCPLCPSCPHPPGPAHPINYQPPFSPLPPPTPHTHTRCDPPVGTSAPSSARRPMLPSSTPRGWAASRCLLTWWRGAWCWG